MKSQYRTVEVNNKKTKQEFIKLPVALYKNEKNWIRPLNSDIEEIFDLQKNKSFRNGECIRWILVDSKNKTVGRVAAFFDRKTSKSYDQPTGGLGFFECINDKDAAFILFDKCKEWLLGKGMEAVDGPINFGERNKWWGLLVDGFFEPNYCVPYNFLYYKDFFEEYGFQNFFNQYTYARPISDEGLHESIRLKAERIAKNPKYHFEHIKKKELDKYSDDFRIIYNKAWAKFTGVNEITKAHALLSMKSFQPIMEEDLMWFAYYDNEPVAFFIMVPEVNQIIKHVNGKLNLVGKIKFFYHKNIKKSCKKALGVIFGIIPEHQGKGLEGGLVIAFSSIAYKLNFKFKDLELNWIGDFNPVMMKVAEQIGGKIIKTHVTYRYLFDRTKEFTKAKRVG